jgi:hypothetical protein
MRSGKKGAAMRLSTTANVKHPVRIFRANLRRKRVLRRLNRDLAGFSNKELADLLTKAGIGRTDLFTSFKGNRPNRHLMGQMLGRFDIDRETACEHHWRKLVHAEKACALCPNVNRCQRWLAWGRKNNAPNVFCPNAGLFARMRLDLDLLARTMPRTYAYGNGFVSSEAETVASAWGRLRRFEEEPYWRRGTAHRA